MEYSLDFDTEPGTLIGTLSGLASLEGLLAYQAAYLADPRRRPGMKVLTDLRALDPRDLTTDELRAIADSNAMRSERFGSGRSAVVVSEPAAFGLMRMFQAFTEDAGFDQQLFYSMDDARRWLAAGPGPGP